MDPDQAYQDARDDIVAARNQVEPGSAEDNDLGAAIDELDLANLKRVQEAYGEGTAALNNVTAKLNAARDNINANPVSGGLDKVNSAAAKVQTFATLIEQLQAGQG